MLGLRIRSHRYLTPGQIALERGGQIVWVGRLGMPIEDLNTDGATLLVSDADYDDIKKQTVER